MSTIDKTGITPEFGDVVRTIIDSVLLDLNVCLPAKIVSYNPSTQYADVEVQLMQKYSDGSLVKIAVIPNVPVVHPRANGGKVFIHLPMKVGDDVTLVFSQRSLDNWKSQGGMTDPADPRKHHITDCYALVGGSAIPDAFAPTTTDSIELVNDQTKMIIKPNGKFEVINGEAEFVSVLDQITTQVQNGFETLSLDTVNTIFGPTKLNAFETYALIAVELEVLLGLLESFKV